MKNLFFAVGMICVLTIQTGNMVLGQPAESCLVFDGSNLKIFVMTWHSPVLTRETYCAQELDRLIGSFHPAQVEIQSLDVVTSDERYREDIFYLTK